MLYIFLRNERHLEAPWSVHSALLIRACFFTLIVAVCLFGATPENPVLGAWKGHAPDPVGRTEEVELRFAANGTGYSGVLRTPAVETPLDKVRLQGSVVTFDATRELRGHHVLYHYEGKLSGEGIEFTVQNDDGSSFLRFTVRRIQ